jgi:hypothetical protein
MKDLADLLCRHLNGPRWEVTRDVVSQQPAVLAELVTVIDDDLQLLVQQLERSDSSTDVRITAEHMTLLLSRLLPVVDAVVADLYMTAAADAESEHASMEIPVEVSSLVDELRAVQQRLIQPRRDMELVESIPAILDVAVAFARLHLLCVTIVRGILLAQLTDDSMAG